MTESPVDCRVLGPVELLAGGERVPLRGKQMEMLIALMMNAGRSLSYEDLTNVLWGVAPPATCRQQLHKFAHSIRAVLGEGVLINARSGYLLDATRVDTDLRRFDEMVRQAGRLLKAGRPGEAAGAFREALALWRGPALMGVRSDELVGVGKGLDEKRITVVEDCVELELSLGRHADVVDEVTGLLEKHPHRERTAGLLMVALSRSGRVADAVDVYHQLRASMSYGLGIEPSARLQELRASMSGYDEGGEQFAAAPGPVHVVPALLPKDLVNFTGRRDAIAELDTILDGAKESTYALSVAAVVGPAGVGKTSLAVHWSHQIKHRFPDGQLYLDLRGFDQTAPVATEAALEMLLQALGVAGERMPRSPDAKVALYRSLLNRRRVLLVLDNVAGVAQIELLLPGAASCFVVVTSRHSLTELVALHDARRISLEVFTEREALELLRCVLGDGRLKHEPDAVQRLANACGNLPLALRIAAANLVDQRRYTIAEFAEALNSDDRLAKLDMGGDIHTSVRLAFDVSYSAVSSAAQELLRYLGVVPGVELGVHAAAALLDGSADHAYDILLELERVHLVEQHVAGRYRLHDLIKMYARARAEQDGLDHAGFVRLAEHYMAHSYGAVALLLPAYPRLTKRVGASAFSAVTDAEAWLREERTNLVASVGWLHELGLDELCAELMDALRRYLVWDCAGRELLTIGQAGLAAADRSGDLALQTAAHLCLGDAYRDHGDMDGARRHLARAGALAEQTGDLTSAGYSHLKLAYALNYNADAREIEWHLGRARGFATKTGDMDLRCKGDSGLAMVYTFQGRLAKARDQGELSVRLAHEMRDSCGNLCYITHSTLGWALRESGQLEAALGQHETALAVAREHMSKYNVLNALTDIGRLQLDIGHVARAAQILGPLVVPVRRTGNTELLCDLVPWLAAAHLRLGDADSALPLLRQAMDTACQTNNVWGQVEANLVFAELWLAQGNTADAMSAVTAAQDRCATHNWTVYTGRCHQLTARVQVSLGNKSAALSRLERARAVHRRTGQRLREAEDLLLLGAVTGTDRNRSLAESLCSEAAGALAPEVWRNLTATCTNVI